MTSLVVRDNQAYMEKPTGELIACRTPEAQEFIQFLGQVSANQQSLSENTRELALSLKRQAEYAELIAMGAITAQSKVIDHQAQTIDRLLTLTEKAIARPSLPAPEVKRVVNVDSPKPVTRVVHHYNRRVVTPEDLMAVSCMAIFMLCVTSLALAVFRGGSQPVIVQPASNQSSALEVVR